MVVADNFTALADGGAGVVLDDRVRKVQNGSRVYHVALKQEYLDLLGLCEQGAPTVHSVAAQGRVAIEQPCYIIQPATAVPDVEVNGDG